MSRDEFKRKTLQFTKALEKRCKREKISFRYLGSKLSAPDTFFYLIGLEVYWLYNDGNYVDWGYAGTVQE